MGLRNYLPQDRLRALARGETLPDRTSGAALFADVSGFTALTEALIRSRGERRGVEELTQRVNGIYEALIGDVERAGGSVIGFAGDAITCWFDDRAADAAARAARCGLAMQESMRQFPDLAVKVAVGLGPARRFAVGHAGIQQIDVVAGATLARVATAEGLARPGEVLIDQAAAAALQVTGRDARTAPSGECFWVLEPAWGGTAQHAEGDGGPAAATPAMAPAVDAELLRPWILPFVFERESAGQDLFATDLRPATALFLRFTGLDYDHDAQAAEALQALVAQTQLALQRHGGVLLELSIGDKGSYLYGSFGAAQVHEDDARRALRAAVGLRQHFGHSPWSIQIGLSSGTMRVGGYGSSTRQSFGAIGDDVNTAARLMGIAKPGEILISGRVRKAVAGEFALEARSPMPVKGKAEPMPVFAVLGPRQQRAIRLQEPAHALPMVGRDAETALLARKLAAAAGGRGQIVGITAEAGVGKSRLVAEAIRLATRSRWIGYGGACQLDGIRTPYLVWQSVWTALFDIDPALPPRRQIRAIEAALQDHAPEHAEAWPVLGAVLGLDWPDNDFTRALLPKDRKALLEAVLLRCLESAAREAAEDGTGVLIVLEDLHAADPLSMELLALLGRAIEAWPVVVLLSYRPPDAGSASAVSARFEALPYFEQIELGGLGEAQAEQVIRAKLAALFPERVGPVPAALIERIGGRAQGNPFYIEEVLDYLHDRGIDPRDAAALEALDLPASLHGLVLSRIDRLKGTQQLSLKVASIIGRLFRVADLHGYYPALGALDAVKADLGELDRLGFTPLELPEPELSYLFKHLVTLEVGYESIAHATRVQLHGQYARHLEAAYADHLGPLAPRLAHHYARAGIADKACLYLRQAGEQAAAAYSNDEALAHFERALEFMPPASPRERLDVLLRREAIHDLQSRHDQRRSGLAEIDSLASDLDEPLPMQARIAIRWAKLEIDVSDYAAARRQARRALQALEAQPMEHAVELLVDALLHEARAALYAGEAAAARPSLDRALTLSRAHGYRRGEYNSLSQMGALDWHEGHYDAAEGALGQALQLAEAASDARPQVDILVNLGIVAKARSRYAQAVGHYDHAQRIARRIGDRSGEAVLLNNMGSACLASGDFQQAGTYSAQAARIFAELNEPTLHAMALINRAEAHRELGQYAQARQVSGQALALLRASGFRRGEAIVLENLGLAAMALGQFDQALKDTHAALTIAQEIGVRALEASTLQHLGMVHTATGQYDAAQQALDAAASLMRELGAEMPALEVRAALADLTLARGGPGAPARALALLDTLLPLLLQPGAADAPPLPLWLSLVSHRVLAACEDPRAAPLLERARQDLRARSEQIGDAAMRRDYLGVAEHRDLMQGDPARAT